jgi:hypothetical protein
VRTVHHRYSILLGLILVTVAFELAATDSDGARLIAVTLQAATLVAAVVTSRAHRWVVRLAIAASVVLVLAAGAAVLGSEELGDDSARVVSLLLVALAPAAIVNGLINLFREEQQITRETMFGVLCIYLLLGLFFGTAFAAVQAISNEDFFRSGASETSDFLYFSFSSLTTTGYGDLVAATNLARSLSITEALLGQIYLVTVVALIIANIRPGAARR